MAAACIALAAGAAFVVLPTSAATLTWTHTVENTGWEEDYSASADGLTLTEARIEAIGAGMEPPSSAVREGGWWRYRPSLPPLPAIQLANSIFAGGYSLCWNAECRPLASVVPQGERVSIVAADCSVAVPPPLATGR
ncbi:MAG TPA: DUF1850 domain-containing protein [Afifellaceae bacterium]|nr:DUF1850 domain-containing protein [Afifellaceae bacterium]